MKFHGILLLAGILQLAYATHTASQQEMQEPPAPIDGQGGSQKNEKLLERFRKAAETATMCPSMTTSASIPAQALNATNEGSSKDWGKWGIPLWPPEYKATPGISLTFYQPQKDVFQYGLIVNGFPMDKTYYLWQKKLDAEQPTRSALELSIKKVQDNVGFVVDRAGENPLLLTAGNFLKGEAFQVALMSEDKTIAAFAKTIPNPIESIQGPYRIWVELGTANATGFIIWGEGFEPEEEIDATSISGGEVLRYKIKADSEGRFMNLMFPGVVGKQSGLATYSAVGKSCEVTVSYQWGSLALQLGKDTRDLAHAAFERGRAAQASGNRDSAIGEYREAIRLKPDFAEAHLNLGNTYFQVGRWEEALASYRECIRINPDYALGHYAIGVWFDTRRQWSEAIQAYREAARLAPKNPEMQFNLGNAYLRSNRIDEAIVTFKDCLAADPRYVKGWMSLGMAYLFAGQREGAVEAQAKLQKLDPTMAEQLQSLLDGKAQLPPLE